MIGLQQEFIYLYNEQQRSLLMDCVLSSFSPKPEKEKERQREKRESKSW